MSLGYLPLVAAVEVGRTCLEGNSRGNQLVGFVGGMHQVAEVVEGNLEDNQPAVEGTCQFVGFVGKHQVVEVGNLEDNQIEGFETYWFEVVVLEVASLDIHGRLENFDKDC